MPHPLTAGVRKAGLATLSVIFLVTGCGESDPTEPNPTTPTAPRVLSVQIPAQAPSTPGSETVGTVVYTDPDGDASHAFFEEVSDPNDAVDGDFDFSITQTGTGQDSFGFVFECPAGSACATGPVTLGVTVEDSLGRRSPRFDFSFEFVP